jgi:recombination protein RecA
MTAVNKKLGPGSLVIASDIPARTPMTTGSVSVDIALGGGWPPNQWSEIIGRESSSKTSLAYMTLRANQERDPDFTALWVAAEAYNEKWARNLGVDNSRVHIAPTNKMEKAYEILITAAESNAYNLLVLDSYPALVADQEDEKTMEDMVVGLGARRTGQFFRKVGANMGRSILDDQKNVVGLFINQFRDAIGGFSPRGTPQTTPGGQAKNYAFYARAELSRTEYIDEPVPGKNMKRRVGQTVKVKVVKNKQSAPHKVAGYDFYFENAPQHGFSAGEHDVAKELVTMGVLYDLITARGGGYYDVAGESFKGKDALLSGLRENIGLQEELTTAIRREALGAGATPISQEPFDDGEEVADAA